jgi:hypothetical protein
MVQRRRRARLLFEPRPPRRIERKRRRQDLQRDLAPSRVSRAR